MNKARSFLHAAVCAAITTSLGPAQALAATPNPENTPLHLTASDPAKASSTGPSIVHTIVGLAIVLAVILGLYWVLRQLKTSREGKASGGGLVSLATLPLGSSRSVHLIRSGRDYVLVGVAEHGITALRTYTEEQARESGLLEDREQPPADGGTPKTGAGAGDRLSRAVDAIRNMTVRA